jgi:aspartate kinase
MIVMKFGGSSVESASAIERVAGIVRGALARKPVVVVSAMGKTTQQLLTMGEEAAAGEKDRALEKLQALKEMHEREIGALLPASSQGELRQILDGHFGEMADLLGQLSAAGEFAPESVDALSSYGERLSSRLIALMFSHFAMNAAHVDARCVVITDGRHKAATPLYSETYTRACEKILPLINQSKVPVLGGFIGSTQNGVTTTLGRGGSDFSAAIIGAGIAAEEIQIWTDVDGVMTCDPKLVPEARRVKTISFAEAAELAYFGAKVLHPKTLNPVVQAAIPVWIRNSFAPERPGTKITPRGRSNGGGVKALTAIHDVTLISVGGPGILGLPDVLGRTFSTTAEVRASVLLISQSSSQNDICFIVATADAQRTVEALRKEFAQDLAHHNVEHITSNPHIAVVAVVGENMRGIPGIAGKTFSALGRVGVNIIAIAQGSSESNISFVIEEKAVKTALVTTHREFGLGALTSPQSKT